MAPSYKRMPARSSPAESNKNGTKARPMGSANQFGIEIQAVASYRRRALLVSAKTHNVLALGWFRAAANF
jgi:hypothetical protein